MRNFWYWALPTTWISGLLGLSINQLRNSFSNQIVFGNYADYISSDVMQLANKDYGIVTDNMDHDQIVKGKFMNGIYDMAVVSTSILQELVNNDLLHEIDWSKLNIENANNSTKISDSNQVKELFTDVVKSIVNSNSSFLKYGVPYFMNKLSFCYTGNKIDSLSKEVSWSDLFKSISKEPRFRSKSGRPGIGLIDDPRTVLSLSRFSTSNFSSVNPLTFEYSSPSSFYRSYSKLMNLGFNSQNMNRNFLFVNANSSSLVDSLASKSISGAFMYNGDCLYASKGGNLNISIEPNQFHMVELNRDIYFLDFLVISKKVSKDKLEKIYKFVSDLSFKDYKKSNLFADKDNLTSLIEKNFDYVKYTPVLKNVFEKANTAYFSSDTVGRKLFEIKNTNIKNISNHYETMFDPKMKSDMLVAFERFKLNI